MTPTPFAARRPPARLRVLLRSCLAGRLRLDGSVCRWLLAPAPVRLGVQTHGPQPVACTPRALDRAGATAEVGYNAAGAAAGHTLPRLMSALAEILAVAVVACHEPMRLAFPA
jgi:hypothetical protein